MQMPTALRLLTSSMTSRDYDVIHVPSQPSKSSQSETETRPYQLSVWIMHTLKIKEHRVKSLN